MSAPRTDEKLFEAYRKGDNTALRTLIERHQDELLRFLYRLTGDRAAAEDVFQETFLQVHQSMDSFDITRRFRPWVFTIAANKARDYLRKKGRRPTLDLSAPINRGGGGSNGRGDPDGGSGPTFVDLLEIDVPPPDATMDAHERDQLVQRALNALYTDLRLFQNLFQPSMKLVRKERRGARLLRRYDAPQTPFARVRACATAEAAKVAALARLLQGPDPFVLVQRIGQHLERVAALRSRAPQPGPRLGGQWRGWTFSPRAPQSIAGKTFR